MVQGNCLSTVAEEEEEEEEIQKQEEDEKEITLQCSILEQCSRVVLVGQDNCYFPVSKYGGGGEAVGGRGGRGKGKEGRGGGGGGERRG